DHEPVREPDVGPRARVRDRSGADEDQREGTDELGEAAPEVIARHHATQDRTRVGRSGSDHERAVVLALEPQAESTTAAARNDERSTRAAPTKRRTATVCTASTATITARASVRASGAPATTSGTGAPRLIVVPNAVITCGRRCRGIRSVR